MHPGTPWNDRLEDDGAAHASEAALRRAADSVVGDALRGLRRAFVEGDVSAQWRAKVLLELALRMRTDLQEGSWARLPVVLRHQLRRALHVLGSLAHSSGPIPIA